MSHLFGALINAFGIICGGLIGVLWGRWINESFRDQILRVIGMVVVLIGLKMAWVLPDPINTLLSLIFGGWIGYVVGIDAGLIQWERSLELRWGSSGIAKGFISGSLIFNIGAMAILGSLQAGLTHRYTILSTKAVLDGTTAAVLAMVSGWGVILSAPVTFLYESGLTLLAKFLTEIIKGPLLTDVTVVGGVMVAAIGMNFLFESGMIRVANLLPALLVSVLLAWGKTHGLSFL